MKNIKSKIRFYKKLVIEIIETLCTICLIIDKIAAREHIPQHEFMYDHFLTLKDFSEELRAEIRK